jgi:glycosyltransferase involved in cell wall biosynthesis
MDAPGADQAWPLRSAAGQMLTRRVVILNNYPLERVWAEVRLGETPDHHLFGINYFEERGYQPVIVPMRDGSWSRWQRRVERTRVPLELGDLQQQRDALACLRDGDLVYAPCASQTQGLQYLRAIGLLDKPIVCLVHHPFTRGRADVLRRPQRRLFVRGADHLPSLSRSVSRALGDLGVSSARTAALRWGPQADYYRPRAGAGEGVVAAGRTGRDFGTLARAARSSDTPVVLIGLQGQFEDDVFRGCSALQVIEQPNVPPQPGRAVGWMKYPELLEHLSGARAVAIPLFGDHKLCGLTSLMDALGLGKPVIMTRNRHIDMDIEALGIGLWVEPGDVTGWVRAMKWYDEHPSAAIEMGARARALVDAGLNSRAFAQQVMDLFDRVCA